jgi:hypothetical protein
MLMTMLAAATAVAFAAAPASAVTWGGEVFGAFNTHSMSDWNDLIVAPINQGGGNMDDFGTGFGGGLGLRVWPSPNFMIAGTWEPLFVTQEEKVTGTDFKVNGNSFQATGYYFFPTTSQAKFGIGAGAGFYSISGEITGVGGGDLTGSTVGFHFLGTGEFTVSPGFAVTGSAGYRIANVSDTKLDDVSSNPEFETDYSGLMLRAGLAFYMPSASGQ